MPMRAAPPSSTSSSAPNSSTTCAAVVGLTRPKRFALGAAMPGTPRVARALASSAWATGCAGQRRPIVGWPRGGGVGDCPARRATMTVSGPGQKASIRRSATGGHGRGEALGAGAIGDVDDQRMAGSAGP